MMKQLNRLLLVLILLLLNLLITPDTIAANLDHINQILSTNICSECDLSGSDLTGAQLTSANLSNSDLHAAYFSKAILKSANLENVDLHEAQLYQADLSNTILKSANLKKATLLDAILSNADLTEANLENANLQGVRFVGFAGKANLTLANLSNSNLKGAFLNKVSLTGANLSNANISGHVSLQDAVLDGANLHAANISDANLINANLERANLSEANLEGANFKGANLKGANLEGANLMGINLDYAVLTDATGLDPYGVSLLQQAISTAEREDFLAAIKTLQKMPSQTQSYSQAQILIEKYTESQQVKEQKQLDIDAEKQVQAAIKVAGTGNYKRAISVLEKISENTSSYAVAQANISSYTEQQQWKEQMEQERRDTERARIETSLTSENHSDATTAAQNLRKIDSNRFGTQYSIQKYIFILNTISGRCSSRPEHIADMSALATNQLFQTGKRFDNMSFLQQALEATDAGLFGQTCENIFASLKILVESGV